MKRILMSALAFVSLSCSIFAQETADKNDKAYQFEVVKQNPITSIKNQASTGTCWSWSAIAFLESEVIRTGKGNLDLSAMYPVRRNYFDKSVKYVRMNGTMNFSQGGSFADIIETLDEYGVIPLDQYQGLNYGMTSHQHNEVFAAMDGYLQAINKKPNGGVLSTAWKNGFNGILDAFFGEVPQTVTYNGKSFTPQGLAKELGLKSENYVSITSFTHHPFYQPFAIEVADNWRWAFSYNLPIDDFMTTIDNALMNGYTVAWGADVSEVGFTRDGIAVVPDDTASDNIGSDQARWLGLSRRDKDAALKNKIAKGPVVEKKITQEMRQTAFDIQETTDDHGMLLYGIAKDQNGNKYYMVKNSWGETGAYKGLWYASEAYVRYKTMNVIVNKNSIPKDIAKKLNF